MKPQFYFVFDVESIGLHGEGYAVGGGVYQNDGTIHGEFLFSCPPREACGDEKNRVWVEKNVPPIAITHPMPEGVRREFWRRLRRERDKRPDLIICAECLWPVEANFLARCISDDPHKREFEGPYPFHDITSILLAADMDPLGTYDREADELPNHNPLCDARQSARLLRQALEVRETMLRTKQQDEEKIEWQFNKIKELGASLRAATEPHPPVSEPHAWPQQPR